MCNIKYNFNDNDISNTFYILRMFGIISVAFAHCGAFKDAYTDSIRAMIGTIGVPLFLINSGYYFKPVNNFTDFCIRKKKIIIPWLVMGTLTYIFHVVHIKQLLSLFNLLRWIFGYLTWLYYVPILLTFYLIFQFSISDQYVSFWIIVFLLFFIFTYKGLIVDDNGIFTIYQIPFNHIGFFCFGILLKKNKLIHLQHPGIFIILLIVYFIIIKCYSNSLQVGYWSNVLSIPFELFSFILLFYLSLQICKFKIMNFFIEIGRHSYFIYFIHMQIGNGIVNRISRVLQFGISDWLKPILIVMMCYIIWYFMNRFFEVIHLKGIRYIFAV